MQQLQQMRPSHYYYWRPVMTAVWQVLWWRSTPQEERQQEEAGSMRDGQRCWEGKYSTNHWLSSLKVDNGKWDNQYLTSRKAKKHQRRVRVLHLQS
jgi:hypothetical protein